MYFTIFPASDLPGVSGAQWASVFLPGDGGFWNTIDLTGEPGHSPLPHRHRLGVRQELWEGLRVKQRGKDTGDYAASCV